MSWQNLVTVLSKISAEFKIIANGSVSPADNEELTEIVQRLERLATKVRAK